MRELLVYLVAMILAWSWVCVTAGRIYEVRRRLRQMAQDEAQEMNARDQWATEMEQKTA